MSSMTEHGASEDGDSRRMSMQLRLVSAVVIEVLLVVFGVLVVVTDLSFPVMAVLAAIVVMVALLWAVAGSERFWLLRVGAICALSMIVGFAVFTPDLLVVVRAIIGVVCAAGVVAVWTLTLRDTPILSRDAR